MIIHVRPLKNPSRVTSAVSIGLLRTKNLQANPLNLGVWGFGFIGLLGFIGFIGVIRCRA